jgi:hypothetical protein
MASVFRVAALLLVLLPRPGMADSLLVYALPTENALALSHDLRVATEEVSATSQRPVD